MKEQDKYYTPEIEEFHIGFEFEVFEVPFKLGATKADGKWVAGSLDTPKHFQAVNWDYLERGVKEEGVIRVKHLDREDIESLGFDAEGQMEFDSGNWGPVYSLSVDDTEDKEKYYNLFIDEGLLNIVFCEYRNSVGRTEKTLFIGEIKNKSELKKVLNMLGI